MTKKQTYLTIIFGIIFCIGLYNFLSDFNPKTEDGLALSDNLHLKKDSLIQEGTKEELSKSSYDILNEEELIQELTEESLIINYIKKHHKLPGYYITKAEARKKGWEAAKANLCKVLPGKAIGGDLFGNREGLLPKNKQYYEADVNYKCGRRNADRIIFTKKGEVWLTKDHYKTFEKK